MQMEFKMEEFPSPCGLMTVKYNTLYDATVLTL